ncbi:MAG TPA: DUF4301 family protein [Bacteroidales bacterium]|nr:DUF4301 family protein [Bacteroidales bacterium]
MITPIQKKQLEEMGISEEQLNQQIQSFIKGFEFAALVRPATINDGIIVPSEKEIEKWTKLYDEYSKTASILKFVPASGAASRMFKNLYEFLDNPSANVGGSIMMRSIDSFAFYQDLSGALKKLGYDIRTMHNVDDTKIVVETLLTNKGLNYGSLPKGLLKFHAYNNETRTATEEHFVEGLMYAKGANKLQLHFTISVEHEQLFIAEFEKLKAKYDKEAELSISYSFQKKSTDTVAVDVNNVPITDKDGKFVFRPGGHGALLENLNDIDADLIFIKNIDNVVPDHLKHVTVKYKKALAGLLVFVKTEINEYINYLEANTTISETLKERIATFMLKYMGITLPKGMDNSVFAAYVKSKLDKPIRVCGMVRNVGEPGGGPFWVLNKKGEANLQIVESSQVDMNNHQQKVIFDGATHFNPVDLVCSTKDYSGFKFNLLRFRDNNAGFISEKSVSGKKVKALELPGLWNGGMAHWITLMVEVPILTFNPVKTYADLLRKEHQPQ